MWTRFGINFKMIVLKESKAVLHLMGLIPGAGITLPVIIWSVPLITLLLPLISYSIVNIHDVRKATDASYVVAADILCIGQYWCLAAQKKNLLSVLDHLDKLVIESRRKFCGNSFRCIVLIARSIIGKSSPVFDTFTRTENRIRSYARAMKIFVITSSSMCLFLPFFVAGYFYLRGTYSPSVWWLPYKVV